MILSRQPVVAMVVGGVFAIGAGVGISACSSSGQIGATNSGQSAPASTPPPATPPAPTSQETTASPSPTDANPATADVQLAGCALTDDPYHVNSHSGQFVAVADLKFTNHSSKVSDYIVSVEFVDAQGNRLDMGYGNVSKLAPGESQNNNSEDATGTKNIPAGTKVTCRILSVDRLASTQ